MAVGVLDVGDKLDWLGFDSAFGTVLNAALGNLFDNKRQDVNLVVALFVAIMVPMRPSNDDREHDLGYTVLTLARVVWILFIGYQVELAGRLCEE
jgi:hypothetical protein